MKSSFEQRVFKSKVTFSNEFATKLYAFLLKKDAYTDLEDWYWDCVEFLNPFSQKNIISVDFRKAIDIFSLPSLWADELLHSDFDRIKQLSKTYSKDFYREHSLEEDKFCQLSKYLIYFSQLSVLTMEDLKSF